MSLGDIFTTTFSVARRRFGAFLGLAGLQQLVMLVAIAVPIVLTFIVMLPSLATNTAPNASTVVAAMLIVFGGFFVAIVVAGIVSLYFDGLMITCANEAIQGRFPTVTELRTISKGYLGRIVGLYLLAMLAYLVGVTLVLLPAIFSLAAFFAAALDDSSTYNSTDAGFALLGGMALTFIFLFVVAVGSFIIGVKVAYVAQVCAIERLSGITALKRAWNLTKGAFWRTFGYLFVFSLIAGAVQQAVSVAGNAFSPAMSNSASSSASESTVIAMLRSGTFILMVTAVAAVSLLIQLVMVPLRHAFVTVMYGDQLRRLELGPVNHAFAMNVPGYGQQQGYGPQGYGAPQGYGYPPAGQQVQYGQQAPSPYGQPLYGDPPAYGQQPSWPASAADPHAPGSAADPYGQAAPPYGQQAPPYGQQPPYGQG
jgi:hypothetical protein